MTTRRMKKWTTASSAHEFVTKLFLCEKIYDRSRYPLSALPCSPLSYLNIKPKYPFHLRQLKIYSHNLYLCKFSAWENRGYKYDGNDVVFSFYITCYWSFFAISLSLIGRVNIQDIMLETYNSYRDIFAREF